MIHARVDYNRIQDPIGKIPADEPVFLFRAQDALACKAVDVYATLCELTQPPEVAAIARAHAGRMMLWPKKKQPDLPPGIVATPAEKVLEAIRSGKAFVDGDVEAGYIEQSKDLNCPCCGGSGHVGDVMVDLAPPATARERWIYEQGRLAERDIRSHDPEMMKAWLVEMFEPDNGPTASLGDAKSLGIYHTGFTDDAGNSRTTTNVWEACRYSEAQATIVTRTLYPMSGFWRAVEYSIGITATRVEKS